MRRPLVSVVMPARNAEETIGYAIASVVEQTMPNLELIVVDDTSTDATAEVVRRVKDARVKLLRAEGNVRCAAARNMGIREARGEWVAFVDADDEWVPERLERMWGAVQGREGVFACDRDMAAVAGPDGRLVPMLPGGGVRSCTTQEFSFRHYLEYGHDLRPIFPAPFAKISGGVFPEWGSGGEWLFVIARAFAAGLRGLWVEPPGYLWRATGSHDSSGPDARREVLQVIEFLLRQDWVGPREKSLLASKRHGVLEGLVSAYLRRGQLAEAIALLARNPGLLGRLPRRAALFALTKLRVARAERRVHASSAAGVGEGTGEPS